MLSSCLLEKVSAHWKYKGYYCKIFKIVAIRKLTLVKMIQTILLLAVPSIFYAINMLSVLHWNIKFCFVLSIKGSISRTLIPIYIHIYVNLFTCTVWQTFCFLYGFEGYCMSRHFWLFINCTYWHFRRVAWYFVGLLSQFKYDFFLWELHQLSEAHRMMPGCLLLVIPLWHFGCISVHFGSDPVTPRAPLREINEGSCNNGDQGQHEVLGSIPLWQGRKFHHIWW